MNGAAHYLSSVFITLLVYKMIPCSEFEIRSRKIIRLIGIFSISFFLHIIIDNLARLTYHPSNSDWGNPIYASWHLFTYVLEATVAIYILRKDLRYFWGMLGSVSFDLWDWSIVRFLGKYADIQLPTIHFMEGNIRRTIFFWLPDWTLKPAAMIIEVIFISFMLAGWSILDKRWAMPNSTHGSWKSVSLLVFIFGIWRLMSLF